MKTIAFAYIPSDYRGLVCTRCFTNNAAIIAEHGEYDVLYRCPDCWDATARCHNAVEVNFERFVQGDKAA